MEIKLVFSFSCLALLASSLPASLSVAAEPDSDAIIGIRFETENHCSMIVQGTFDYQTISAVSRAIRNFDDSKRKFTVRTGSVDNNHALPLKPLDAILELSSRKLIIYLSPRVPIEIIANIQEELSPLTQFQSVRLKILKEWGSKRIEPPPSLRGAIRIRSIISRYTTK